MANKEMNRRDFLQATGMLGVGLVGTSALLSSCGKKTVNTPLREAGTYYVPEMPDKADNGKEIRVALVGCGGRGYGAMNNVLAAADNVKIVALADVCEDRLQGIREDLKKEHGQEIPDEMCFIGFDAYKKALDADVNYAILTTPPAFRPEHYKYAVEKGIHCFLEKPVCVDPKGYRTVMAAAKQAKAKNLVTICGTQRHHERQYVEAFQKISEGMIGEITGGNVYWNQGMLWYRNREKGWSDMEWMIRDWVNWTWLSGDHIVEQHVHNIDVFLWMSGFKVKSATAFGSRQRRVTGDQYDNFSVDFECENGVHFHSMCRQIDGCANKIGEMVVGTKGVWTSWDETIRDHQGNVLWAFDWDGERAKHSQFDPYTIEHIDAINHIRRGESHDEATACAMSTLAGIMGREAAYTGKAVTWDEMSQSEMNLVPENPQMGPMDLTANIPVPGSAQ